MANNRSRPFAAIFLSLALASVAFAEERDWTYSVDADGNVSYSQFLTWTGDPNALKYRVTVETADGSPVTESDTQTTRVELRLTPGTYRYRIATYNVLGKKEFETEWVTVGVIEAIEPTVADVSPNTLYIDDLKGKLTVRGKKIGDECVVTLRAGALSRTFQGRILERSGDGELVVSFPDDAYNPGTYDLTVENPGGLSSTLKNAVTIRYQKPVDFHVGVSYAPFMPLHDAWFKDVWPDPVNPLSAGAEFDALFVKRRWGLAGVSLEGFYRAMAGGIPESTLSSQFMIAGASAVAKYRFTRKFFGVARLGAGYSRSFHAFDYEGFEGPKASSADPFARAGIGVQYALPSKAYLTAGVDWTCVFFIGHQAGGVAPRLGVGYQF